MKALLILATSLIFAYSSTAQQMHTKLIEYDVQIRDTAAIDENWFMNNIEASGRIQWITPILDSVKKGSLKVYDIDSENKVLSSDEVYNILHPATDTFFAHNDVTGNEIVYPVWESVVWTDITHVRFLEEWSFDSTGIFINKKLVAFAFIASFPAFKEYEYKPLFWIKPNNGLKVILPITQCIQYRVVFYDFMNGHNKSIDAMYSSLLSWAERLMKQLKEGSLSGYYWNSGYPTSFTHEWQYAHFKDQFEGFDTLAGPDPITYEDPSYVIIQRQFDPGQIEGIAFREEWSWHPKQGLIRKIIAFAPLLAIIDDNGSYRGCVPLVWLKYE